MVTTLALVVPDPRTNVEVPVLNGTNTFDIQASMKGQQFHQTVNMPHSSDIYRASTSAGHSKTDTET